MIIRDKTRIFASISVLVLALWINLLAPPVSAGDEMADFMSLLSIEGREVSEVGASKPQADDVRYHRELVRRTGITYGSFTHLDQPEVVADRLAGVAGSGTYRFQAAPERIPTSDSFSYQGEGPGISLINGDYALDRRWRCDPARLTRALRGTLSEIDPQRWPEEFATAARWAMGYKTDWAVPLAEIAVFLSPPSRREDRIALLIAVYAQAGRSTAAVALLRPEAPALSASPDVGPLLSGLMDKATEASMAQRNPAGMPVLVKLRAWASGKDASGQPIWSGVKDERRVQIATFVEDWGLLAGRLRLDRIKAKTTDELVRLAQSTYWIFGSAHGFTVDLMLYLVEDRNWSGHVVRGPELVWTCIQAYRLYGVRSMPLWVWMQKDGLLSQSKGKGLYHDYFNAMESGIYGYDIDITEEEIPDAAVRAYLVEVKDGMLVAAQVIAHDPDSYEQFLATWGHRYMVDYSLVLHRLAQVGPESYPKIASVCEDILSRQRYEHHDRLQIMRNYGRMWSALGYWGVPRAFEKARVLAMNMDRQLRLHKEEWIRSETKTGLLILFKEIAWNAHHAKNPDEARAVAQAFAADRLIIGDFSMFAPTRNLDNDRRMLADATASFEALLKKNLSSTPSEKSPAHHDHDH